MRAEEGGPDDHGERYVAWDEVSAQPFVVDPAARGADIGDHDRRALTGLVDVATADGPVACRPAFEVLAEGCRAMTPATAEIERAARVLWEHRPVAFYSWSGVEQHNGTTQIVRAINALYALTGCLDVPGGNVLFTPIPTNPVSGAELLPPKQRAKAIGVEERPLGGPVWLRRRGGFLHGGAGKPASPGAGIGDVRVEPPDGAR